MRSVLPHQGLRAEGGAAPIRRRETPAPSYMNGPQTRKATKQQAGLAVSWSSVPSATGVTTEHRPKDGGLEERRMYRYHFAHTLREENRGATSHRG